MNLDISVITFLIVVTGLNLVTTLKIAFWSGEYKRQVDINTQDVSKIKKAIKIH